MHCWFLLLLLFHEIRARNSSDPPEITAVSAMCSSDGITASVDFDGPFNGKIYSLDYASIHDCIYYNALDMDTILFSIPAHRCGTRLSRTSRNVVDQMVNRVYVQMDRDFQSAHDKQFSFVCQLADGMKAAEETKETADIRWAPQKDSGYVTPPPPVALSPSVTPVKAMSTDARQFGNWPIPGAKSYDPAYMKPAPVFPRYPIGPPISTVMDANSYVKPAPQRAPPIPQYLIPTQQPIVAQTQRDPVVPIRGPQIPHNPVKATSYQLPPPQDGYARPPAAPVWPAHPPAPQRAAPIIPSTVNKHQGIGLGMESSKTVDDYTKVPAQTWNLASTVGYVRPEETKSMNPPTAGPTLNPPEVVQSTAAKVFKEEPPRIGFTSDDKSVADQTVSVNTEPLISRQETRPTDVFLEIQRGDGPFSPTVSGPVKIGENISLVVRSTTKLPETDFDMFVHSCFATDGPGTTRVQLTDEHSCVLRHEFVDEVHRVRAAQQQFYFFRIAAFKFPGPDDVYFSCSIELTPNRTAPAICPPQGVRWKRDVRREDQRRLFDMVKVELAEQWEQQKRLIEAASCVSPLLLTALTSSVVILLVSLLAVSYLAMSQHFRLQSHLKH